jgi:hypothetical protein
MLLIGVAAVTAVTAAAITSGTAAIAEAAPVPSCTASDLGVWIAIDQANGTAGTAYYPLQFTNLSQQACSLYGYPGVSALGDNGQRLGSPADWATGVGQERVVVLSPGATAHTLLAYHDVVVYTGASCGRVESSNLLSVIPPGQRTATDALFGFPVCSRPGADDMSVYGPIEPGPGTMYST